MCVLVARRQNRLSDRHIGPQQNNMALFHEQRDDIHQTSLQQANSGEIQNIFTSELDSMVNNIPVWATPVKGGAFLQPVLDSSYTLQAVKLDSRQFFRVGRSQSSDIILNHDATSRRHAIIFHDPFGICFIIDCNSTHGTYINGNIIKIPNKPHRVRRGSLLRFGAPGAPTFIMKSFMVQINDVLRNLDDVADAFFQEEILEQDGINHVSGAKDHKTSCRKQEDELYYFRHPQQWVHFSRRLGLDSQITLVSKFQGKKWLSCIRGYGGGMACISDKRDAPDAALVLLNTRQNAMGSGDSLYEKDNIISRARERFSRLAQDATHNCVRGEKRNRDTRNDVFEISYGLDKKRRSSCGSDSTMEHIEVSEKSCIPGLNISKRRVRFREDNQSDYYYHTVTFDGQDRRDI